ncbi:unnamed protein product [marine sediment metagenome]|uniref:UDP-glucose/GDP-mannose dehydrogenase C-terminal domain-containing protein n=1 Tax=marine sediment metagenome TaxID=412755 RepID=X1GWG1_9ZZZZ
MGACIKVHDPYVEKWLEIEAQNNGQNGKSGRARFFSRQGRLNGLVVEKDMWAAMKEVKAIVLAVPHKPYLNLDPDKVFRAVGRPFAIIDCFCILDDSKIRQYLELGCEVKGMGRGHIKRIKESIREAMLANPNKE